MVKASRLMPAIAIIVAAGCGLVPRSSGPMTVGPDTYRIIARAAAASVAESQKMAFSEANQYCASLSRQMVTVNTQDAENAGFILTFRCLKEGDPDLIRPTPPSPPEATIKIR